MDEVFQTIAEEFPHSLRVDIEAVIQAVAREFPLASKEEFLLRSREILK